MILRNIGLKLLGIWLIFTGILPFLNLHIPALGTVLAILALFAGILILIGR
jgi:hypothetical protein